MRTKSFTLLLSLVFLFACNSSKDPSRTAEHKPLTAENWEEFWTSFTSAVEQKNVKKVADLTRLPLPATKGNKGFSEENFTNQFNDFFDAKTAETFSNATDENFRVMPSNSHTAGYLKTPVGVELKFINVAEASKTFVFGAVNGQYKLLALMQDS